MIVTILCGGRGSRLGRYTDETPKPMVAVGDRPLLWHLMAGYAAAGHREFVLCLGYRGDVIRRYFAGPGAPADDRPVRTREGWTVRLCDTGADTMTGGRLLRVRRLVGPGPFLATYGDCLADVDLDRLLQAHAEGGRAATLTVVRPPARFGVVRVSGDRATSFQEKPVDDRWINGGFFVFSDAVFDRLRGDDDVLERSVLDGLAAAGELTAYRHDGFWQCMDTPAEMQVLNELWRTGSPEWVRRPAAVRS